MGCQNYYPVVKLAPRTLFKRGTCAACSYLLYIYEIILVKGLYRVCVRKGIRALLQTQKPLT